MNFRRILKNKIIGSHYLLSRFSYYIWRSMKSTHDRTLVIYQMGKVGSTSILYSLQNACKKHQIFQVHVLTEQGIRIMEKKYWGDRPKIFRKSLLPETEHLYNSHYLKSHIGSLNSQKKWKIITLVRDPIARNVSEFFYSVDTSKANPYLPDFYEKYGSPSLSLSDLMDKYLTYFCEGSEDYLLPLEWYDHEFGVALGFDIYSTVFPKDQGYQIIRLNNFDILVLKLEQLSGCYLEAFKQFLGLENFDLIIANTSTQKKYFPIYREFITNINLPTSYVQDLYTSKYVKHFYSDQEIQALQRKWSR